MYCEDYPCCGHTDGDPCPGRSVISEPWYCDYCGMYHYGECPGDSYDETDDEDEPYFMEDQWLDGSYEE